MPLEIFIGPGQGLFGIEIADDHERGVIRFVESVEEGANVFDGGVVQVGHAADGRVMVGVFGEGGGAQIFLQVTVGLIFDTDAALFLDDLTLGFKIFLGDVEAAHAVGFEPQDSFEIVAGEGLVEIGGVVAGFSVVETADGFNDAGMLFSGDVRGTLEHQMLEEMGEAGMAGLFVFRADVIPDLKIDDWDGVIFEKDDLQAIGQGVHGVGEFRRHDVRGFLLRAAG